MVNASLQAALDAINMALTNAGDESQQLIRAKCRGLMRGYDARWRNAGYVTLEVEQIVSADLWNPVTGHKSRKLNTAGKIDVIAEHAGRRVLLDHKTTSQDISDPDAPYWRQLVIEGQASHYMLLEWLNGDKVDGAVWDVVRKPGISPKTLSKTDRQRVLVAKEYCGQKVTPATLEAIQREERETLEMYEARLAQDCIHHRPQWHFQRRAVPRLDVELLEYAGELWDHGQELLQIRRTGRHVRNSGACMLYGSPCKFLGICSGHDSPDSDKWQRKEHTHRELDGFGDKDTLTNSRIRCFQTCRRKHYYEYELGIERQDEEEREALLFGTVWHAALESWWLSFMETEHDNANSSPANGVGTTSDCQAPLPV